MVRESTLYCDVEREKHSGIMEGSDLEKRAKVWAGAYADRLISFKRNDASWQSPRLKGLSALQVLVAQFHYEVQNRLAVRTSTLTAEQLKAYKSRVDEYWSKVVETGTAALALPEEKPSDDERDKLVELIFTELQGASREFSEMDFYGKSVRVVMGPIAFGDLQLGRFRIALNYESIVPGSETSSLLAKALEPNFAWNSSDSISHPHVDGGHICLGDGSAATAKALIDGRYFDAMLVVREVLRTYSSTSPYRKPDRWTKEQNRRCAECEEILPGTEGSKCTTKGCRRLICTICAKTKACGACKMFVCAGHTICCTLCRTRTCPGTKCAVVCGRLGAWVCKVCADKGMCCNAHKVVVGGGDCCSGCKAKSVELMAGLCAQCMTARTLMPVDAAATVEDDDSDNHEREDDDND